MKNGLSFSAGFAALLVFAALATNSCAALRRHDLSPYPPEQRTLFLYNFSNNSFQPDVHEELTEMVRHETLRRGNFSETTDSKSAALGLYGRVRTYRREGRMFDNMRNALRVELIVICRIRLLRRDGSILLNQDISARVNYSRMRGLSEDENSARRRLLHILAVRIADAMEEAFAYRTPLPRKPVKSAKKSPADADRDKKQTKGKTKNER